MSLTPSSGLRFLCLSLLVGGSFLLALPLHAGTISISWDPVVHEDLAGYRIYYGTSPDALNQTFDTGLAAEATLSGLADCTTYYLAVKAVTQGGLESQSFSNLITGWARPEVVSADPVTMERGTAVQLALHGSNFQDGAAVQLSNADVAIGGVTHGGCGQLLLDLVVGPSAATGPVDVRVINPDQVFGDGSGLFAITVDTSGPQLSDLQAESVGSTTATVTWATDEPSDSQVFWREVGASTYQATDVAPAQVTEHAVELTGLAPGTAYEFYARSVDGSGNASTAAGAGFTTSNNGNSYLRIEAESVTATAPLESRSGLDAFDGEWVSLAAGTPTGSPGEPSGVWEYGFHLPEAGNWRLWFRVRGDAADADGWLEGVDGAGLAYVQPTQAGDWEWVAGRSYTLDAGLHTLALGGYEPGASLDRVILTDDPEVVIYWIVDPKGDKEYV